MPRGAVEDPIKVFRFRIVVDGFVRAGFQKCTGLERNTEVVSYREGGQNDTEQKSPGLTSFPNITFERGQLSSANPGADDFRIWAQTVYEQGVSGAPGEFRKDFDIVQYDAKNIEIARWTVEEGWPTKYKATGDFNAQSSDNSIEVLEIAHEGWRRVT